MPKLILKGPRRRESERVKTQSNSATPSQSGSSRDDVSQRETTRSSSRSRAPSHASHASAAGDGHAGTTNQSPPFFPEGDNIVVRPKQPPASNGRGASQTGISQRHTPTIAEPAARGRNLSRSLAKPNRPWGSKGKAPARYDNEETPDLELPDANDHVEEFDFDNEPDDEVEDDEDDVDEMDDLDELQNINLNKPTANGAADVITISSDDEKDFIASEWALSSRPWKHMSEEARIVYEGMLCHMMDRPLYNDWSVTEDYQREKDKEMLRYLEDFPLPQWLTPQPEGKDAHAQLLERVRLRTLGARIYRHQVQVGITGWTGRSLQPHHGPSPYGVAYPPHGQRVPSGTTASATMPQPAGHQSFAYQGAGYPNHTPVYSPSVPVHLANTHASLPGQKAKGKYRAKKTEPTSAEPQVRMYDAPTPPYEPRAKPTEYKGTSSKPARRTSRRHAEAQEFPWNRGLNFPQARASAKWDESGYDPATLASMVMTRKQNGPILQRIDREEIDRQRSSRAEKKQLKADGSDVERRKGGPKRSSSANAAEGGHSELYHSGQFCFATDDDQARAEALFGDKTPDAIILAAEKGTVLLDTCKKLMISWNPGKRGYAQDLQQIVFSVKDTVITRQQLARTPILTRRAAECIIDFCPDILWRDILLRIVSEAGYANKHVRDRMCVNGNYCDKATITKRIGSALGQKQQQSISKASKKQVDGPADPELEKIKGYAKMEEEFYNHNIEDYKNYAEWFGMRTSHRNKLDISRAGTKRKAAVLAEDGDDDGSAGDSHQPTSEANDFTDPLNGTEGGEDEEIGGSGVESVGGDDAVSVQSDTVLDEMDDD